MFSILMRKMTRPLPSRRPRAIRGLLVLNGKQKRYLRSLAHALDPVVQVGKAGLSDGVLAQVREQLRAHELVKVRFAKECELQPAEAVAPLCEQTDCAFVQKTGRVLTLYRRHDHKPKIELPR